MADIAGNFQELSSSNTLSAQKHILSLAFSSNNISFLPLNYLAVPMGPVIYYQEGALGILDPSFPKKYNPPFCDAAKVAITPLRPAWRYWGLCLPTFSKVVEDTKMTSYK